VQEDAPVGNPKAEETEDEVEFLKLKIQELEESMRVIQGAVGTQLKTKAKDADVDASTGAEQKKEAITDVFTAASQETAADVDVIAQLTVRMRAATKPKLPLRCQRLI